MQGELWQLIAVACIFSVVGVAFGILINYYIQKMQKDSAQKGAEKIRRDAEREVEHLLRDARVSAKAEVIKMREECEQEIRERRREQQQNEKRLTQREENLDRRADSLDEKLKGLEKQEKDIETLREKLSGKEAELARNIASQVDELERISGYSREQVRDVLLEKLQNEIRNEAGIMVRNTLEEAKERSEKRGPPYPDLCDPALCL